jgi:hypothetical protein
MTNNKQQTAVEWLIEQFYNNEGMLTTKKLLKAKAMEKEQIVEHHTWLLSGVMGEESARIDAEQYYKETYE